MRIRETGDADDPMFNLTPMIDCVFQLLIFFMVATTYKDPEKEIDIDLPRAQSGESAEKVPDELTINVFRDGRLMLSGAAVDLNSLQNALRRAAQKNPETPVTIRGDKLVHHEEIVKVMDACGLVGLGNLSLGTLEN